MISSLNLIDQLGDESPKDSTSNQLEVAVKRALSVHHPLKSVRVLDTSFVDKYYLKKQDPSKTKKNESSHHLFGTAWVELESENKSLQILRAASGCAKKGNTAVSRLCDVSKLSDVSAEVTPPRRVKADLKVLGCVAQSHVVTKLFPYQLLVDIDPQEEGVGKQEDHPHSGGRSFEHAYML